MRIVAKALLLVLAAAGLAAPAAEAGGEKAVAELKAADGTSLGRAEFIGTAAGVLIRLKLSGLTPGPHGLRIHETGRCEGDFSSAGGIYNPLGAAHGFLSEAGPMAGDLPNVVAGANGEAEADILTPLITLSKDGEEVLIDEDGASLVLLEKADDYISEPDGNAGARIACGALAEAAK